MRTERCFTHNSHKEFESWHLNCLNESNVLINRCMNCMLKLILIYCHQRQTLSIPTDRLRSADWKLFTGSDPCFCLCTVVGGTGAFSAAPHLSVVVSFQFLVLLEDHKQATKKMLQFWLHAHTFMFQEGVTQAQQDSALLSVAPSCPDLPFPKK